MKAVQIKNDSYEATKLEALHDNLLAAKNSGYPLDYEIRIDDFPVVARNNDPQRFMNFSEFITPQSKYITVLLYRPNSPISDKYFFHLQENKFSSILNGIEPGLAQLETETKQKERLRKELDYDNAIKENEKLKKELQEMEELVIRLHREKKLTEQEHKEGFQGMVYGIADAFGLTNYVKGFGRKEEAQSFSGAAQNKQEEKASFHRKDSTTNEGEEAETEEVEGIIIGEEDKPYIQLLKGLKMRLDKVEVAKLMYLIELTSENPSSLPSAIKQTENFIKGKGKNKF